MSLSMRIHRFCSFCLTAKARNTFPIIRTHSFVLWNYPTTGVCEVMIKLSTSWQMLYQYHLPYTIYHRCKIIKDRCGIHCIFICIQFRIVIRILTVMQIIPWIIDLHFQKASLKVYLSTQKHLYILRLFDTY